MADEKELLIAQSSTSAEPTNHQKTKRRWKVSIGLLAIAGSLLTLGAVSHLARCRSNYHGQPGHHFDIGHSNNGRIDPGKVFLNIPSTDRLRENLRYYTSGTHVAGVNRTQAVYTRDYFKAQGIDAEIVEYYPWMNYPVDQRVALFNETTQRVVFEAGLKEDVIPGDPASEDPNNLPAFHGYSADGNVTGQLVYANYGSLDDFRALKAAGVSVKDKIVLVRYGGVFRGLKVYGAELDGARGVLIYSDPADDGYVKGKVYPEGPWRPESSFQRGSVQRLSVYPGDPLTPGYAATKDAPRIDPKDAKNLNSIPSLPLSYRDAEPLLRALQGQGKKAADVGENWVGGLTTKGVEYWTGPSELSVNLLNKVEYKNTPIQNVIARIKGWDEPERAVIIGNHRDAWCAGASDPSSGSAALLELARGLGELQKLGWRPRRTIILASWDAEEYGLVGSTEWVEDNKEWLQKQAIAYVNVDEAVTGGKFHASASPLYKSLLYSVAHKVPYLDTNQTVYEHWVKESTDLKGASDTKNSYRHHKHSGKWPKRPPVPPLGSGSDYTAFNDFAGISSVDLGFSGPLAIYHSNYDSFKFVETFTDPGFKLHKTLTQVWGLLTIELADLPLVPFNPITYAWDFKRYVDDLESLVNAKFATHPLPLAVSNSLPPHKKTNAGHRLVRNLRKAQHYLLNSAYRYVSVREAAVARFGADCKVHKGHRQKICAKAFNTLNSQVSFFERHLLDEAGLPGRSWFKNVVVSPGLWKGYGSQTLPGLTEAAADGDWKRFKSLERRTAHIISNGARVLRRTPHYA